METYGVDYGTLKPGIYLQVGGHVKALDINKNGGSDSWISLLGLDKRVAKSTLADKESWTFTALDRRAQQLISTPAAWVQGSADQDVAPFELNMREILPQLDKALQIQEYGAFLYKWRVGGKKLGKLVWLDPTTVTPDIDSADLENGIVRFKRDKENGKFDWIPAEDIIWFKRPGQRELQSDPSPLDASRLNAEILYNIARMEDFFFETNGLPVMLIKVPSTTSEVDKGRIEKAFDALFNRTGSPREIKTKAVREGVEVQILSFKPNEMDLKATKDENRQAVLAVHNVPESIAMSNAANYATASSDQVQFANTMASRYEAIAEVLNMDPDIAISGYMLDVRRNELPVLQEEEVQRAAAFGSLVMAGLHPQAVMAILGYDLPENYNGPIFREDAQEREQPEPEQEEQVEVPVRSVLWDSDAKALKSWLKNRGPGADVGAFNSNELTYSDKLDVFAEVFGSVEGNVYP